MPAGQSSSQGKGPPSNARSGNRLALSPLLFPRSAAFPGLVQALKASALSGLNGADDPGRDLSGSSQSILNLTKAGFIPRLLPKGMLPGFSGFLLAVPSLCGGRQELWMCSRLEVMGPQLPSCIEVGKCTTRALGVVQWMLGSLWRPRERAAHPRALELQQVVHDSPSFPVCPSAEATHSSPCPMGPGVWPRPSHRIQYFDCKRKPLGPELEGGQDRSGTG